jgi:topoisomerase-4 subunit A
MEIRREHKALSAEQAELRALIGSEKLQWKRISDDVKALRKAYGPETPLGRRRTGFAEAPVTDLAEIQQAMIEREPITVVLSEKGWIRALKGHVADLSGIGFKGDDSLGLAFPAETTDRIVLVTSKGRAFTLAGDRLPGGRGHGEPVRLMADIEPDEHVVSAFAHRAGATRLIASNQGRGFVVGEDELIANTRKGRQVMPLGEGEAVAACVPAEGDTVAAVGENRKLLLFPLKQVPQMARGRGVRLQRYAQGGLSDVRVFRLADGLTWTDSSGRTWTVTELQDWLGERASAGRLPPKGFPRNNRFVGKA